MTFKETIKEISKEQVDNWWDNEIPRLAPEKEKKNNWKYNLERNGKIMPFKYAIRNLFNHLNIGPVDFESNEEVRNTFCEKFDFQIHEELVFDRKDKDRFIKYLKSKRDKAKLLQDIVDYMHKLVTSNLIRPYDVRFALNPNGEIFMLVGMRKVCSFKVKGSETRIGFIVDYDVPSNLKEKDQIVHIHEFSGEEINKLLIFFNAESFKEIPIEVIESNKKVVSESYDIVKGTRIARWNVEANTTNDTLKYVVFNGVDLLAFISENQVNHSCPFFEQKEFDLLSQTSGVYCDRSVKEDDQAYNDLMTAYSKVEYWANQVIEERFSEGRMKIVKRPTSQGNHFTGYLWSRIYPTLSDLNDEWLAITLGLDELHRFVIKIDIYRISETDPRYTKYQERRGEYENSDIVIFHSWNKFKKWDNLLEQTIKDIEQLLPKYYEMKGEKTVLNSDTIDDLKHSLNTILFGPPGTGKTYRTALKAVSIIDGISEEKINRDLSRQEVLNRYRDYVRSGNIVFTTFHQSMSYEDFVEGIKPQEPETDAGQISYKVENGIFKKLCLRANSPSQLGFEQAYERMISDLIDDQRIQLFTLRQKPFEVGLNRNGNLKLFTGGNDLPNGVLTKDNILEFIEGGEPDVAWKGYFHGVVNKLKSDYNFSEDPNAKTNKYVLVIDEINRGNVSAIFGELITLLETDKRLGNDENIQVKLPYSKKDFGVPNNLYIVGTMNTADRSVEALDSALRRRFSFEEIRPNPEVFIETNDNNGIVEYQGSAIDMIKILSVINERIQLLLDKDHQIGHSYFIGVEQFSELVITFKDKIIPLLEEYFFGDFGKIGLVIGGEFIHEVENQSKIQFAGNFKHEDRQILRDKKVYKFSDHTSWSAKTFISIYDDSILKE